MKHLVPTNSGSQMVGNGAGTVDITDDSFERTCKCGFRIKVDEDDNKID